VAAPSGLRTTTIVLFWVGTVLLLIVGLVAYNRGTVVDDFLAGTKTSKDVDDSNDAVAGSLVLWLLASLAVAIVLSIWSHRTVRNAKQRDPSLSVSPGLAAGGWYIPIGWYWVPWQQLRNAAKRFGPLSSALTAWQALFIGSSVLWIVGRSLVGGNVDVNSDNAVSRLHSQGIFFVLSGVALGVSTIMAMRAMREIDRATSGQGAR
jgi:hypothetical protein